MTYYWLGFLIQKPLCRQNAEVVLEIFAINTVNHQQDIRILPQVLISLVLHAAEGGLQGCVYVWVYVYVGVS